MSYQVLMLANPYRIFLRFCSVAVDCFRYIYPIKKNLNFFKIGPPNKNFYTHKHTQHETYFFNNAGNICDCKCAGTS